MTILEPMRNMKIGALHVGRVLLACAAVALSSGASAQGSKPAVPSQSSRTTTTARPKPVLADAIVAVVNNEVITRGELLQQERTVERRMKSQGIALPPEAEFRRQLLERMIVDRAQLQLAKEDGIHVDDTMLDRAIERIAEQNKMTVPQFREVLEREGTPMSEFRNEVRDEILMQRVREREVDNKIQISESEIDNYLAAREKADKNQEYEVAHILIRIPENAGADQIAARRKRAEEVLQQLRAGGDFAKLAATYSDATDGLSGGDLGWRGQDRLPQLFVDELAKLQPGQISPIMKSASAFHIIKLVGKRSADGGKSSPAAVTQTHVRHILIKTNEIVTPAEAKRKLLDLKQRLENHAATFEELAKLYSNDLSASSGGDLGWVYPGDTVPEFERAMNALKPGEISDPVQTPFGYHLIQVLGRKTDEVSPERKRMQARQAIRERKLEEATQEWLRQLRDRAYVEYRSDVGDAG